MSDRRNFLKKSFGATFLIGAVHAKEAQAKPSSSQWVSIIDLDLCDGCVGSEIPDCVAACRQHNKERFPEPKKPLTPYNWLYVEKVILEDGKTVFAPRRCMHCFDAPCRKICPFGAIDRSKEGALQINPEVCFGGAKCRDVCPWQVPQRQAGVGLYLDVAPKFAGGGVMYKCNFCADSLRKGEEPLCSLNCPKKAMIFLPLKEAIEKLRQIAAGRLVYGLNENGGTATWYVSSVPFEKIQAAMLKTKRIPDNDGRPGFPSVNPELENSFNWAAATLVAPVAAVGLAYLIARRNKKRNKPKTGD